MPSSDGSTERQGLSIQTLAIAAISSGAAAVITSTFWQGGTVFAASMTPVVVAIVREMLERPMQSEVVKRSASRVTDVATARRAIAGGAAARTERERERSPATGSVPQPPSANGSGDPDGEVTPGDVLLSHPRRTYASGGPGRSRRLKIAVVTGLLAFVIAAVVLTVPELVLGGSVGSQDRSTTIFGGGKSSQQDERRDDSGDGTSGRPEANPQQPSGEEGEPAPAPAPEDGAAPEPEEPAPPAPAPSEPAPAPAPAPGAP